MNTESIGHGTQAIPTHFPVIVLMQCAPSQVNRWADVQWQAIGVMAHADSEAPGENPRLVHEYGDVKQYLYTGFEVHLYVDECESYYYNLMSPSPRCYVIARLNEENIPIPFQVSMSFDEAHAYMETDEDVYAVDVPPELYRWAERFVLANYFPEKRKKRKRDDWKNQPETRRVRDTS